MDLWASPGEGCLAAEMAPREGQRPGSGTEESHSWSQQQQQLARSSPPPPWELKAEASEQPQNSPAGEGFESQVTGTEHSGSGYPGNLTLEGHHLGSLPWPSWGELMGKEEP